MMNQNDVPYYEFLDFLAKALCGEAWPDDDFEEDDEKDEEVEYAVGTIDDLPFDDPCDMDCSLCEDRCDDYYMYANHAVPFVNEIIFNPPATIVKWVDGTKTVVKCSDNDRFDRYLGFAAAVLKKMFGSTSRAGRFIEKYALQMKENKKD